ncbi:hypothetical protein KUTeg_001581 [Tegillarca granosa]|uniref:PPM-type phosphatase domain-containing protein n=1 Tax=Tegillarca granosa TaxID=220873 RepID=A0ABQ9FRV6_TEGGR|nr:hypothetical protein KUTeg_001581 [Tegillarca granosa]
MATIMDLFSDLPEPSDSQQNDDRLSYNSLKTSDKSEETKDDTKFNDEEHLRCGVEKRKLEDVEENISNNGLSRIKPSDIELQFMEFMMVMVEQELLGNVESIEKDIKKVLTEVFKKTDEEFLKEASKNKPVWKDGTTATVVLVINDTLFVASLGDSQAFLCREKQELNKCLPIHLTTVHNPSLYDERIRIQKAGGSVKDGRVMGVLEVSRSIGDGQYKKHGVSCIPDDKNIEGTDMKSCEDVKFETACSTLANEAVLRLSADNVTILLISLTEQ